MIVLVVEVEGAAGCDGVYVVGRGPVNDDVQHLGGGGAVMVSASSEENQPMMTSTRPAPVWEGRGEGGVGVRIIGRDPADDDVQQLGGEGRGGGAVSASLEENQPMMKSSIWEGGGEGGRTRG